MQETWVRFLGPEDPLEKEMAIHSSILAWKIPWTEEPGGLQSMGSQESDMTEQVNNSRLSECLQFAEHPSLSCLASNQFLLIKEAKNPSR